MSVLAHCEFGGHGVRPSPLVIGAARGSPVPLWNVGGKGVLLCLRVFGGVRCRLVRRGRVGRGSRM